MTYLYRIRDMTHKHRARDAFMTIGHSSAVSSYDFKDFNRGHPDMVDVGLKAPMPDDLIRDLNRDNFWVYAPSKSNNCWEFVRVDE